MATVLLTAAALPAAAQLQPKAPAPAAAPQMVAPPGSGNYWETTLQVGTQWRLVEASGYAVDDDGRFFTSRLYLLRYLETGSGNAQNLYYYPPAGSFFFCVTGPAGTAYTIHWR